MEFHALQWPLFASLVVLASWALLLLGRHLRDRNRIREIEVTQRERIEAMERGLTLPNPGDADRGTTHLPVNPERSIYWFRTVSLAIGLFLLFAGLGMVLAFGRLSEFDDIWAVGFIPAMGGVGLLLFYLLTRGAAAGSGSARE